MSQPRPLTIVTRKTLAASAAFASVVAHGAPVAEKTTSLFDRGPLRMGAAVVLGLLAAIALVRMMLKLAARRADSNLLDPASELTTLTFPPSPHSPPRLHRSK